jgi:hypothetical protein
VSRESEPERMLRREMALWDCDWKKSGPREDVIACSQDPFIRDIASF